jgi:coenzyme PQQ precursor peptide PqqA
MNLLMQRQFECSPGRFIALQHNGGRALLAMKILLANFWFRITLEHRAEYVRFRKESQMVWKTPRIVEVPVGMEINMYACAARK